MLNIQIPWPGWEVSGEIGRGGFGAVYEIKRNVLGVEEHAAMKQITIPQNKRQTIEEMQNEGYDQSGITQQFKSMLEEIAQEYHLMQQLKGHTNVVYCDDIQYIQHDDGMGWDIFIKMELLTPLTKILQEASAEQQVIRLGKDICSALILCKNQKIIHRDIKPQNLFISRTGDYKLGDFGIAKTAERTTGGTKIGTYKFMAPEVYKSQPYGSSVDIYSLGLVMYWLLNEYRAPFLPMPPEIPTGRQEEEARQQRFSGQPIPAPKHGSEALRDIVLKACAYNPVDRFSGPEEMLSALNRLTAAETAVPEPEIRTTSAEEDETQTVGLHEKREAPQTAACRTPAPERDAVPAPAAEPVEDPTTGEEATHGIVQNNPEPAPITPQPAENAESPEEKTEGKFTTVSGKATTAESSRTSGIRNETQRATSSLKQQEASKKRMIPIIAIGLAVILGLLAAFLFFNSSKDDRMTDATTDTIAAGEAQNIEQRGDGTAAAVDGSSEGYGRAEARSDIVAIAAGIYHTVGLRADGTVAAVGNNDKGQCDVATWTDIVEIAAGGEHTVGLRSDGTVLAVGLNDYGQCDVGTWTDIIAISAGYCHTVGLRADGTVVAVGWNDEGECDVETWTDIIAISAGYWHTVGLRSDGIMVAVGWNDYGECDLATSTDIIAMATGCFDTVGLRSDGTVVAVGWNECGQCDVATWTDIVEITAGGEHTVGLCADGTVAAGGNNDDGQCDVETWTDIVAIAAGDCHTVGLRADGTVVAVGWNEYGQCDVETWSNIKQPE